MKKKLVAVVLALSMTLGNLNVMAAPLQENSQVETEAVSKAMQPGILSDAWTIRNEQTDRWRFAEDGSEQIEIMSVDSNLWGSQNNTANLFLRRIAPEDASNFTVQVKVNGITEKDANGSWHQIGLMLYQDDDNFVQLARKENVNDPKIQMASETNQTLTEADDKADVGEETSYYLKIQRSGNQYTGYYSTDGSEWTPVASMTNDAMGTDLSIGLFSASRDSTSWVGFEEVLVNGEAVHLFADESEEQPEITALEDEEVETGVGVLPELPKMVKATYSDGTWGQVAVTWEREVTEEDVSQEGSFTLTGSVAGTSIPAQVTIYVVDKPLFDETEWTKNPEIFEVNAEDPHATFFPYESEEKALGGDERQSAYYKSLNGTWKFKWAENPESRPRHFQGEDFNDEDWDDIQVPCSWTMLRDEDGSLKYDHPIYTNTAWAWNGNDNTSAWDAEAPSYVNPVGSYRTTFELPKEWEGRRVSLNFDGVESAYYVWVNGEQVGYAEDTFSKTEFDITPYLHPGENTVAVQVYKWSDGSWQEDQDMLYYAGIFRDVYLVSKDADAQIRDFELVTNLDEEYQDSSLEIYGEIRAFDQEDAGNLRLDAKLMDQGQVVAELGQEIGQLEDGKASVELKTNVTNPRKWSAEDPYLYDLVLTLSNEERVLETTAVKVGFREIEIKGQGTNEAQMYINGESIFVKGVNRQELNEETGRYVTREQMEEEFKLMKQNNFNALRMGHYPNAPYVYELCDKYGIYVMSEANVETHGNQGQVSGNPRWGDAVLDRVETMFQQHKNNACVVFWSVGNEQGAYDINKAAYYRLKELDRSKRVVNYDQDQIHSDIISQGYRLPSELPGFQGQGKPYLMLEYAHAMGNSVGNLRELWDVIEDPRYPSVQGGFIWDWVDQALPSPVKYVENEIDGATHIVTGELMTGRTADKETKDRAMRGYAVLENTEQTSLENAFSFEADIKPDVNTGRTMVILSKGNSAQLRLVSNYRLEFQVNSNTISYTIPTDQLKDSNWHRVLGSCENGVMRLYFDGQEVASGNSTGAVEQNGYNLVLGSNEQAIENAFYGRLDNLHVYTKAVRGLAISDQPADKNGAIVWCDMNGEHIGTTGETYFAYGGDWMDYGNNANFSVNGMLQPDKTVQAELYEVKKVYQNGEIRLGEEEGTILVENKSLFTNLDKYEMYWELKENDQILQSGTLDVSIAPSETKQVSIPWDAWEQKEGCEYWLNVSFRLKQDELWADKGHTVIEEQMLLNEDAGASQRLDVDALESVSYEDSVAGISVQGNDFQVEIDKATGEIKSFVSGGVNLVEQGPIPNYFRALVDNDRGAGDLASQIWRWQNAGTGRTVESVNVSENEAGTMLTVSISGTLPVGTSRFSMTYYIYGDGTIRVDHTLSPTGIGNDIIPVVGNILRIPREFQNVTWYGKGPFETTSDRKTAAKVDVYESTVEDQFFPYVRPQETGNHNDVRWMALTNEQGQGLLISSPDTVSASALMYTPSELAEKAHPYQLEEEDNIVLRVDGGQIGVGGAHSWGSWPIEEYLIRAGQNYSYTYYMTPIASFDKEEAMKQSKTIYEASAKTIADSIVSIDAPSLSDEKLKLPSVPDGFTISIESSDNTDLVSLDGTLSFGEQEETVTLVLKVTKESDGSFAYTAPIQVALPQITPYHPWEIIREDASAWKFAPDGSDAIMIKQTQGSHWDSSEVKGNNIFVVNPNAEDPDQYSVTVKMTGVTTTGYEQAGLILYKDDMHFVQVARMHKNGNPVLAMNSRDGGGVSDVGTQRTGYTNETVYFKITKNQDQYTCYYSEDERAWEELGTVTNASLEDARIGVFSSSEEADDWFTFEDVRVDNKTISFMQRESGLSDSWSVLRQNDSGFSVPDPAKDQLSLTALEGTMAGSSAQTSQNLVVTPAPSGASSSNYEITVKMTGRPQTESEAAGLLIYVSDDRYVRVNREYRDGSNWIRFISEDNGSITGTEEIADPVEGEEIWLRLTRNLQPIDTYTASYSVDGTEWTEIGTLNNTGIYGGYVGVLADGAYGEEPYLFENFCVNQINVPFGREVSSEEEPDELDDWIRFMESLSGEEYTAESWAVLEAAIQTAKEVAADANATQARKDAAITDLIAAFGGLEYGVQKQHLQVAVVTAKTILEEAQNYEEESVAVLQEALKQAKILLEDAQASQDAVNRAAGKLLDAIAQIIRSADLESLESLIAAVEGMDADKYTSESWAALEAAIEAAKTVAADADREDADLADAYRQMSQAIRGLVMKGNKAALEAVMEKAREILGDASRYTESSISGLADALAKAQEVYDNADASQAQVSAAAEELTGEVVKARLKGDVDGDGSINTKDSAALLRYSAERMDLDAKQLDGADVNGDGVADTKDAVRILQYAVEKIPAF